MWNALSLSVSCWSSKDEHNFLPVRNFLYFYLHNQDEDCSQCAERLPDLCSRVHVDIVIKISHCCRECTLAFVVGCMQILWSWFPTASENVLRTLLYKNWLPNIWRRLIYTNLHPLLGTDGVSGWSWKPEQQQLITITPDNSYDQNLVSESFF